MPPGPELEGQEGVELLPVVAATGHVLGEQALDRLGTKQAGATDHGRGERVADERAELAPEPSTQRDAEALLGPGQDFRGSTPWSRTSTRRASAGGG